jgi:DNA-binding response OmpR family regulator
MKVVAELERQGYHVHFSETSTAAIRKFENHKPNIILIGVKLPFMEAYNICNFLHSSPELRRIPILMISPENVFYGKSEVRKLKASSADYFTKKIDIEKLTFKINEVVDM